MSEPFGDLPRLLRHLDARLDAHPTWPDLLNSRALARLHAGDTTGARQDLEAALGINPDYQTARANLSWLLLRSGDASDVGRAIDLARPLPESWRRHLDVVRTACTGDPAAALAACSVEAATDPWLALDRLWLCMLLERHADAEAELRRIAARDGDLPAVLHAAGLLARGRADLERLSAWARAYAGNPQSGGLCQTASELAHAAGDIEGSRRTLAWGVALTLDLCTYWCALGTQHESLGEERAALVALRRAVQVDPDRVAARVALGYLFAARGLPAEAIAEMEVAARLAPSWADVRYQLALLYSDVGRGDDAERELRAALATRPSYVLANLALGCLLEQAGKNEEALELLQSVRRAGLRSADLEARLAALHARLGHRNQARRAQSRARSSQRPPRGERGSG